MPPRIRPPDYLPSDIRDHPAVAAACCSRDIGRLFRLVENLTDGPARFTQSHLARRCGISPSRVGEYMAGKHQATSVEVIERVADGLRIPGAHFGLGRRPWEQSAKPVHDSPHTGTEPIDPPAHSPQNPAPGDDAVTYPPGAVYSTGPASRQQPVSDADIAVIRGMLTALTATDHQFGGGYARRAASAFLAEVIEPRLTAAGPEQARRDLLRAASEFGVRVAWMHLDVGDGATARRTANHAFRWAQESGDLACSAWVMSMCALQETWIGDPRRAVAYARAAVGLAHGSPALIRAFAHGKLARALALTGDRTSAQRALGVARDRFDEAAGTDDAPVLETVRDSYNLAYLLDEEAHCYRDLGDGRIVLTRSEQSLELRGPDRFARNRAFATGNQALAYVQLGEIEQACTTSASLLTLSASINSRRVETRIDVIFAALAPYHGLPAVDSLHEQAASHRAATSASQAGAFDGH